MKHKLNKKLFPWVWKWHFIGGILSAPIIILLAITGIIYLFKDDYEASTKKQLKQVEQLTESKISYQEQWEFAKENWEKLPSGVVLPESEEECTEFFSGKFSRKSNLYVDPYSKKIKGVFTINETDMHKVRKLHGELLLGRYGTKVIELVASWMVVLIITGVFIFWPRGRGLKGFFTIRTRQSKRILYRDIHVLLGFWLSLLLLLVIAGGLPWTDVFGGGFKWVQKTTQTGYPSTWENKSVHSYETEGKTITLDKVIEQAKKLNLDGTTMIEFPKDSSGVFSIYNITSNLGLTQKSHLDQYTGAVLIHHTWKDFGILTKARRWVMAFHQGRFGLWNWYLMIMIAFGLFVLSAAAIISYLYRKQPGNLGIPNVPDNLALSVMPVSIILILGILLPLFGLSVILIFLVHLLRKKIKPSK